MLHLPRSCFTQLEAVWGCLFIPDILTLQNLALTKRRKQTEKLTEQDMIPVTPASDGLGRRIVDLKKKKKTENHDDKLFLM